MNLSWISVAYSQKDPEKFRARQRLVYIVAKAFPKTLRSHIAEYLFYLLTRKITSFTFKLSSCTFTILTYFRFEFISTIVFCVLFLSCFFVSFCFFTGLITFLSLFVFPLLIWKLFSLFLFLL